MSEELHVCCSYMYLDSNKPKSTIIVQRAWLVFIQRRPLNYAPLQKSQIKWLLPHQLANCKHTAL